MIQVIEGSHALRSLKLGALLLLALGMSLAAEGANATCNVVFSVPNVQMGNVSVSSLRMSSVPGYRLVGTKNQVMNVTCNVSQPTFRLELSGLTPVIGTPLVRWGSVGAMHVRALGASVAGLPVNIKLEGLPGSIYAQGVDLTKNDILDVDLSSVPARDRKSFSLQFQLTGLLPESYVVRTQVTLDSSITVQLLGVQ